jgi:hypothetical protein
VPLGSFEKWFPMMWWGFWLNLTTGIILFCLDADLYFGRMLPYLGAAY